MVPQIAKAGFRQVPRTHHPDTGGTTEEMRHLLDASHALEALLDQDRS
jgi:hypothetical protein